MNDVHAQTSDQNATSSTSGRTLLFMEVARLLIRLHEAGMLDAEFAFPEEWRHKREFSAEELTSLIRRHLSREGWQHLLEAFRYHNRQPDILLWDLSTPSDFLAALEFTISSDEMHIWEGRRKSHSRPMLKQIFDVRRIGQLFRGLGRRLLNQSAGSSPASDGSSPFLTFMDGLNSAFDKARARARTNRALNQVASYVARALRDDMEREIFLQRVNRLRSQMQEYLDVFCEEEGIPKPKPYSRDEAIYLHLLSTYFVAIAEAEEQLKQRANQLAQRKISLEEQRVRARLNSEMLPELLEVLQETDPLREGLLRERIRHKIALTIGSVVTAIASGFWEAIEATFEASIIGIARFAPIVAPAMFVGLITLAAQTVKRGIPLTLEEALLFFGSALWNSMLALGATLLAFGCWQYFTKRGKSKGSAQPSPQTQVENNGSQATAHMA